MNKRILSLKLEGKTVLGFDTGLSGQAFAQAKMAQFITSPGCLVYPDGKTETWQAEGVTEYFPPKANPPGPGAKPAETMVVWGSFFEGEGVDDVIDSSERKDEALNALGYWLRARKIIEEIYGGQKDLFIPGPAGALIAGASSRQYPQGTIFFPPARLLKRTLEAEGAPAILNAERWVHPDLEGDDGIAFCAGTMLYKIFCGAQPFQKDGEAKAAGKSAGSWDRPSPGDELRQDMREGVFTPPELAAPGLDLEMAALIRGALSTIAQNREIRVRPASDSISALLSGASSRSVSSWFRTLDGEELSRIQAEREQYSKKKARSVKTRRFVIRNTAILALALGAFITAGLIVYSTVRQRADMPNTRGMNPIEVAEMYYGAFENLDHSTMEACVVNKAGKGDIDMVVNLFVVSRMRMAYEVNDFFVPAQVWVEAGMPPTDRTVFGVTDLSVRSYTENGDYASLELEYLLWLPFPGEREEDTSVFDSAMPEGPILTVPDGYAHRDRLAFVMQKGAWRISEIERTSRPLDL